jgi:2'-5' RNA ligase
MARLFTAIELGDHARAAVIARQVQLAAAARDTGDHDLRITPPRQLHLTLVFIGEVREPTVQALEHVLEPQIGIPPFAIEFGEWGMFPPAGRPRVLWLGVTRGAAELSNVYRIVADRVHSADVPCSDRPYQPHLTIGRWRAGGSPSIRRALPRTAWSVAERVDRVTLFRSRLLPGGAEHTPLMHTALVGTRQGATG